MNKISGTKEWASSNENILFGCQHDCLYCYAKAMSPRHKKIDIKRWNKPIIRFDKLNKKIGKRNGTIMFPTTHDIHPENLRESINFLEKLLRVGNDVLIVSKPHAVCIEQLCLELDRFKDQILFRFTIGSVVNEILKFWEPNAPIFEERLMSLKIAFGKGFKTSVSCEPMLDNNISYVIEKVSPFVTDSIWIGKMNNKSRVKINGHESIHINAMVETLFNSQSDDKIIDLYNHLKDFPKIKWKESIKEVVGIESPKEKGLDI